MTTRLLLVVCVVLVVSVQNGSALFASLGRLGRRGGVSPRLSSHSSCHSSTTRALRLVPEGGSTDVISTTATETTTIPYTDEQLIDEDSELIARIEAECLSLNGVPLDQLINPGKVVNLERDLKMLSREAQTPELEATIAKKRATLEVEKRLVMRGWLKGLFVGQSVLAIFLSLAMVYDAIPNTHLPLPVQVLGFWMWWLFIVPSLRARKPKFEEKEALNIAFLATPVVSFLMPTFTKNVGTIWWANAVAVAACYAYAFLIVGKREENNDQGDSSAAGGISSLPPLLVKAIKALDYGSGQERGTRQ